MADLLPDVLRGRFGVADGDALGDFVRLESDSLIARNSFSQRRLSPLSLSIQNPANNDKSIVNNRLARICQFPLKKSFLFRLLKALNLNLNRCLDEPLPIIQRENHTKAEKLKSC